MADQANGPETASLPVGEAILDAGLARYEPSAAARPCRASLLAAEAAARAAGLGLWANPYYAVIAAADRPSFAEKAGTTVIVEGRVTGIADRRPRIMLYFGPRRGWDFSVANFSRTSKTFEMDYAALAAMNGRMVRVCGLLDTRFGPQIEISNPDEIEVIGQDKDAQAAPPRNSGTEIGRMGAFVTIAGSRRSKTTSVRRTAARMLLAAVTALLLAACASMEPQDSTPFNAAVPVPPPRAAALDEKTSAEHRRMIALFDGEYKYPPAEAYLNEILVKLAKADEGATEPYKVTILNSPIVNAFALPPGNVYVTRGLLALATDASEVAAVMAHEIAHITAKHAMQREEEQKRAAVISQAASVIQSKQKSQEVEALAQRTIASFSRQQELEADQIGIRVSARAGFDPYGAARFLGALGRSAALRGSLMSQYANTGKPDILATHPSTPDRVAQATNAARQIGAPGIGVTGRAPYLAAIDGMTFGDDPAEGAIRGRKFLHGRLGFAFLAPEGFVLENASQALLGIKAGGTEALRVDSVTVPQATPLAAYIASGWIDGLIPSSIETTEVNGMPAATATASAGEWNFLLAVIRFDPERVYRLIFATRVLTDEAKARFRASIDSFHRVSPDEVKAVRPLRLAISVAKPGDTDDTLAARMAVPERALDYFLLINDLARGEPLQRGERYKIVVE